MASPTKKTWKHRDHKADKRSKQRTKKLARKKRLAKKRGVLNA